MGVKDPVEFECELSDGKYTYRRHTGGGQTALRHGEAWPPKDESLIGDNFTAAFGYALEEALQECSHMASALRDLRDAVIRSVTQCQPDPQANGAPLQSLQHPIWTRVATILARHPEEKAGATRDLEIIISIETPFNGHDSRTKLTVTVPADATPDEERKACDEEAKAFFSNKFSYGWSPADPNGEATFDEF